MLLNSDILPAVPELVLITSGVGPDGGVGRRRETGLWKLDSEPGQPAGLKEMRVGWKDGKKLGLRQS